MQAVGAAAAAAPATRPRGFRRSPGRIQRRQSRVGKISSWFVAVSSCRISPYASTSCISHVSKISSLFPVTFIIYSGSDGSFFVCSLLCVTVEFPIVNVGGEMLANVFCLVGGVTLISMGVGVSLFMDSFNALPEKFIQYFN